MRLKSMVVACFWVAFAGGVMSCSESVFAPVQPNTSQYGGLSTEDLLLLAESYYLGAHNDEGRKEVRLSSARSICSYLLNERQDDLLGDVPQLRRAVYGFVDSTMEIMLGKRSVIVLFFGVLEGIEVAETLFGDSEVNREFLEVFFPIKGILDGDILEKALYLIPKDDRTESDFVYVSLYNMIIVVTEYMEETKTSASAVEEIVGLSASLIPFEAAIEAFNADGGSDRLNELQDRFAVLDYLSNQGDAILHVSLDSVRAGTWAGGTATMAQLEEVDFIDGSIDRTDGATLAMDLPIAYVEVEERQLELQPEFDNLVMLSNNVMNLTNNLDMSIVNLQNDAMELVAFLEKIDERIARMQSETEGARNAFSRHLNTLFGLFLGVKDRLRDSARGVLSYQDVLANF